MGGQSKPVRLPPWGSAVAGATGAVLANAIVYPLDMYVEFPKPTTQDSILTLSLFLPESKQNFKCK